MYWKLNKPLIFQMSQEQIEDVELFEEVIKAKIIQDIQEFIELEDKKLEEEIMNGTDKDKPQGILRMSDIK